MPLSTSAVRKGALVLAFSVLAVAFCAVSLSDGSQDVDASYAPSGTDITYDGVVYVTTDGSGHVAAKDNSNRSLTGPLTIPSTFVYGGETYTVTALQQDTFRTSGITEVTLPSTLTSIGARAFQNVSTLTKVTFTSESDVTIDSFGIYLCSNLKEIQITGAGKLSVYQSFCRDCPALVTLGETEGVVDLRYLTGTVCSHYNFQNCSSITEIIVASGTNPYCEGTSFSGCTGVQKLTINDSQSAVQSHFMSHITTAAEVVFNANPVANACEDHTEIGRVILGSAVTSVGASAFSGCTSLGEIQIHSTSTVTRSSGCFMTESASTEIWYAGGSYTKDTVNYDSSGNTYVPMPRVTISPLAHGSITPSPSAGMPGDIIALSVTPDDGYVLATINGVYNTSYNVEFLTRTSASLTFKMPSYDVSISASFSDGYYSVDFYESASRITVQNVEKYYSVLLPVPAVPEGYTFEGWYSDSSHTRYIGPIRGAFTPSSNTTLYALFTEVPTYGVTVTYTLDGADSDYEEIRSLCIDLLVPSTLSEGVLSYVVAVPDSEHSISVSSTDAFIKTTSSGVYAASIRGGTSSASLMIDCTTLYQGIGNFRITGLTEGQRGASFLLESSSSAGLMPGSLHFSGVYCRNIGDGVSEVRAYGAITDGLIEQQTGPSSYSAVTSSGIQVQSFDLAIDGNVRLMDPGSAIYNVYSTYIYTSDVTNTVVSEVVFGSQIETGA